MIEKESSEQFKLFDWVVLIVATTLSAFIIPHIAATTYLASTAVILAGPEPIIIIGGLLFLTITTIIVWRKMRKLRKTSSQQTYRKTGLALIILFVAIISLLNL